MTRVEVVADEQETKNGFPPVISSPGDLKLVRFYIEESQDLVFHVRDLLAFTSGVRLRSIYTAHVAAHFLGLGSFYSVASGPGYVVLLSEGARVRRVNNGLSTPAASLLAWDRKAEFSLSQQVSFSGVWFNDPSVVSHSPFGAGVLDEGRAGAPGLLLRLWHLVRYLFMPF